MITLDHPVVSSLLPVVLLIVVGLITGKAKLIRQEAVRDLSNLVFLVLTQALLFRTMSSVHVQDLDFQPVSLYFAVAAALFTGILLVQGASSRAAVIALSGTFSNTVMIGIPLVGLAYGKDALVLLFTLISLHALVLLTMATVVLELLHAREQVQSGDAPARHPLVSIGLAVRNAIQGTDMAQTGMYRDARGYKVLDTTLGEAAAKAIGFQPRDVDRVQDATFEQQRAKSLFILASSEIRAKWAKALFEGDQDGVQAAREAMAEWNRKNPTQRMAPNMPAINRRVKEMRKSKEQRIADTAPKAIRNEVRKQLAEDLR